MIIWFPRELREMAEPLTGINLEYLVVGLCTNDDYFRVFLDISWFLNGFSKHPSRK